MFNAVKERKGECAGGDLREWADKLVGGGRLRWEPVEGCEVLCRFAGKPRRPASLRGADAVRPICVLRFDLVAKQRVPASVLVKLEPLKEP